MISREEYERISMKVWGWILEGLMLFLLFAAVMGLIQIFGSA